MTPQQAELPGGMCYRQVVIRTCEAASYKWTGALLVPDIGLTRYG